MLLYSSSFKTGITRLLEMYDLNEKGVSVQEILVLYQVKCVLLKQMMDITMQNLGVTKKSL